MKNMKKQTRGWHPKDPTLFTSNSTRRGRKLENWVANPFSTLGGLMIVASLLSATFGSVLVSAYFVQPFGPESTVFYSGLYAGIISLAAFGLGLYAGINLLSEKHVTRTLTGIATILGCGIASLVIPIFEGLPPQSGLIVATPMITAPSLTLFIATLNSVSQRTLHQTPKEQSTIRERAFTGLSAAGIGFLMTGIALHFVPFYSKVEVAVLFIAGILLVTAFLTRRTYKR